MAIAAKRKLPWLCSVSSSLFITLAAAPTAFQRTPSSPATTRVAFKDFVLNRISPRSSPWAALSSAFSIAGPIDAANFSFTASASYSLKNATACCGVNPLVYSGNGCVAMRMVCTWYPRDSKVVCARRNIFSASATCSLYCARSRLMNAVIARIFGFSCVAAGVLPCAHARVEHEAISKTKNTANRIERRDEEIESEFKRIAPAARAVNVLLSLEFSVGNQANRRPRLIVYRLGVTGTRFVRGYRGGRASTPVHFTRTERS